MSETATVESRPDKVREILLSFIFQGKVTSFELPFLFSDRGMKVEDALVRKALEQLIAEGNVKAKDGVPQRYVVTWRYLFKNVFDYSV
jgi:hypothetical protein